MKSVNDYQFQKITSVMAKEFGEIRKGMESGHEFLLSSLESNLVKTNRRCAINKCSAVADAIRICLFTIHGYINGIEYDLSPYLTKRTQSFAEVLLLSFDPFRHDEIRKIVKKKHRLDTLEDLRAYFTEPVQCLLHIEKSVEHWAKRGGPNGYFTFLEHQIGSGIENDDTMTIAIQS